MYDNKNEVDEKNPKLIPETADEELEESDLELAAEAFLFNLENEVDAYEDTNELEEINESENIFKEAQKAYSKVDDNILAFIANFVENHNKAAKQNKWLKGIFFAITMCCFSLVIVTPIVLIIVLGIFEIKDNYIALTAIVSTVIEVLTTIIILPKIVAQYLFNKEEENSNIKIVELMQKYSETMHGYDTKD